MKKDYVARRCNISLLLTLLCISSQFVTFVCGEEYDYQKAFDDYINEPTPEFKWHYTGNSFHTLYGHKVYMLNVTTVQWLDESVYDVVNGSPLWTHELAVIVPKEVKYRNVSTLYMVNRCNSEQPLKYPFFRPDINTADLEVADIMANDIQSITVISFQTPNCPMVFKDDPDQQEMVEDPLVVWTLKEFFNKSDHKPERIIFYPMAKAGLLQIKAAQEFIRQEKFAELDAGWFVAGISKRGWTSYMIGAANQTIANILGIIPMNPILPSLNREMHHQIKSYGGLSFAFQDFVFSGLVEHLDGEIMQRAFKLVDPLSFHDRLKNVPKQIITASADEFMMFEWSQYWQGQFGGETHLMITPNADHSLFTNIPGALSALTVFIKSIQSGHTSEQRPQFNTTYDQDTGQLSIMIPEQFQNKVQSVYLRHAETMSEMRRDFRWFRTDSNLTEPCEWPWFKLPFGLNLKGQSCVQLILWDQNKLEEDADTAGLYSVMPPEPTNKNHWIGYYIEVYFEPDTDMGSLLLNNEFALTTPGYVWPNTFPYPDCQGDCKEIMI